MKATHYAGTRRPPIALVLVVSLHIGFIYIFNEALGLRALLDVQPANLIATVIEERNPIVPDKIDPLIRHEDVPHITLPELPIPEKFAEEPLVLEPVADPIAYTPPDPLSTGTAAPEPQLIPVRPKRALTQPEYPASSLRNDEEGAVDLAVFVLRDGRVADVRVVKSSGYERLDRAAMQEARRRWRLEPARRGEVPIDGWGSFRVIFQITGR